MYYIYITMLNVKKNTFDQINILDKNVLYIYNDVKFKKKLHFIIKITNSGNQL